VNRKNKASATTHASGMQREGKRSPILYCSGRASAWYGDQQGHCPGTDFSLMAEGRAELRHKKQKVKRKTRSRQESQCTCV
jgi:hypothetical protein